MAKLKTTVRLEGKLCIFFIANYYLYRLLFTKTSPTAKKTISSSQTNFPYLRRAM